MRTPGAKERVRMDTSPEPKKLPSKPSLEHLQKQAKQRVKQDSSLQLAAAQHQIAQEYGFKNWAELAKTVEAMADHPHSGPVQIAKSGVLDPAAIVQARLDAFLKGTGGGIGAVWVDGSKTVFFQAGTHSKTNPAPITSGTIFDAGSISKVFTALLLAESERLGKVSRFDPAAKYLFPANDPVQASLKAITLLSLATHTSGLPLMPFAVGRRPPTPKEFAEFDRNALMKAFRSGGAAARPAGLVSYSNFGFALLGEALAVAWEAPFSEVLSRQVFEPLGMTESTVRSDVFAPSKGVQTSTRDMAKFLSAALGQGDTPLRPSFAATLRPQFDSSVRDGCVGLGWMLMDKTERAAAWHGWLPGIFGTFGNQSFVALNQKTGTAIAILTNAKKSPDALGFDLLGVRPPKPKVEPVAEAASYVGHYTIRMGHTLDITEHKGGLRAQFSGWPPVPLRAIGPDRFALAGSASEISFERDATGQVIALNFTQRGLRQPLPQPPAAVELPADALREYSGRYAITPTFIVVVSSEGNELFVQVGSQSKLCALASAKDRFFVKSLNTKIHFRRDETGQVSGIVVLQNGRHLAGSKCVN
jgi:CubicO group peptidase (beta-lactamase class C family)